METPPAVRYARSGEVYLAYAVFGDGPIDLVLVPGFVSHLELAFDEPSCARFLRRLGSFCRVVSFDKRGTGLSDRLGVDQITDPVTLADDVAAVMDAAGLERAAVLGISEGGSMAIRFTAEHPERVSSLVVYGCWAKSVRSEDFPEGTPAESFERFWEMALAHWGDGRAIDYWAPSRAGDAGLRAWMARLEREAASPGVVLAIGRAEALLDVRPYLAGISVPTLVLHRRHDRLVPVAQARYLAEHIPGATYLELEGRDHLFFTDDADALLDGIETFLTGTVRSAAVQREVATLLFTDIVGSTGRAAALGDRRWGEALDGHDRVARACVHRAGGTPVKSLGDGLLATFATPGAALRAAEDMRVQLADHDLAIRVGIHAGEIERRADDVGGLAVHIAARIGDLAQPGEILVSRTVVDLLAGSAVAFTSRGCHALKGVPGTWEVATVDAPAGLPARSSLAP